MAPLVLSDTSPLIALGRVGGLGWLPAMFGKVHLTNEVLGELNVGGLEEGLVGALDEGWLVPHTSPAESEPVPHLGAGEWSCIRAGQRHDGPTLVLMDDRLGRREAHACGLTVVGTAGIIGIAQTRGIIPSARDIFDALLKSDFRIAPDVIRAVLERVGEGTQA